LRVLFVLLALVLPPLCLAQSTCFTDPHGTTICSSPGTVVHGNTDSTGHSLYRDDRGNRLDFETDRSGKAVVKLPSGESINWSQRVLGEKKYPFSRDTSQLPSVSPTAPGSQITPPPAATQVQP
jgi:hypothetical protein